MHDRQHNGSARTAVPTTTEWPAPPQRGRHRRHRFQQPSIAEWAHVRRFRPAVTR